MIPADALKFLAEQAVKASVPPMVYEDEYEKSYLVNGELVTVMKADTPPRKHKLASLADLIELANRFAQGQHKPVVWYDETSVVLVIDDDSHRVDLGTLTLEESDVFTKIVELRRTKAWFEMKPFVRLLRIDLARTLEPGVLLEKVRKLRFENGMTVTAESKRNRESLGAEITSKVTGEGDIPEEVVLSAPVYKTPGETARYGVRCTVETDPAMGTLQLLPMPDEIERVRDLAVASIAERLRETLNDTVPAYYGKP